MAQDDITLDVGKTEGLTGELTDEQIAQHGRGVLRGPWSLREIVEAEEANKQKWHKETDASILRHVSTLQGTTRAKLKALARLGALAEALVGLSDASCDAFFTSLVSQGTACTQNQTE